MGWVASDWRRPIERRMGPAQERSPPVLQTYAARRGFPDSAPGRLVHENPELPSTCELSFVAV